MAITTITAKIRLISGLHIGGDNSFSAIGTIDNQVIKDVRTKFPYIPGSSIKGKMRSLLAGKVEIDEESEDLKRLFGYKTTKSLLSFSDCQLDTTNDTDSTLYTEVKAEVTIPRTGGNANPRKIERVTRGTRFNFQLSYTIDESNKKNDYLKIVNGLKLLTSDYLGGNGTRGSGRIIFEDFNVVPEEASKELLSELQKVTDFGKKLYQE